MGYEDESLPESRLYFKGAVNDVTRHYDKVGVRLRNQRAYMVSALTVKSVGGPRRNLVGTEPVGRSALRGVYYLRVGNLQNFDFGVYSVLGEL